LDDLSYQGFTIELFSLALPGKRWRPRAILYYERDGAMNTLPTMSAPDDLTFPTEEEADHYAVDMAKRWIDAHPL
jgi:hypothetical protein